MKEGKTAVTRDFIANTMSSKIVRGIITQISCFLGGLLLSGGAVFGSYAPFGAAMVAAVPFKNLFATLGGTILGYILSSTGGGFRYIATVLAIGAIRWTLSDLKKLNKSVVYPPLLAFLPMLATGIVLSAVSFCISSIFTLDLQRLLLSRFYLQ